MDWKKWAIRFYCILAIIAVFNSLGTRVPPDVNEAHYLVKAKHFADRSFCQTDLFASSAEPHWLFYATHGWLCQLFSFPTVALIGRFVTWTILAFGLLSFVRCFVDEEFTACIFVVTIAAINRDLNLAGEWFVGGLEGKGYAYGFLFAGLTCWLRSRFAWMIFFLGLAAAFHVVVGMWAIIALLFAIVFGWWRDRKMPSFSRSRSYGAGWTAGGLCLILAGAAFLFVGLIPGVAQNWGVDSKVVTEASKLQSLDRLAHHQLVTRFHGWVWFVGALAIWLNYCVNGQPCRTDPSAKALNRLTLGSLLIWCGGLVLSMIAINTESGWLHDASARLLTLYWFRLADVMLPTAVILNGWVMVARSGITVRYLVLFLLLHLALTAYLIGSVYWENKDDPRSNSAKQAIRTPDNDQDRKRTIEAEINWIKTCFWIRDNTDANAVFLTPPYQQTFKWYAHRADFVNWKDMPQDAPSVLEWDRRLKLVYGRQLQDESAEDLTAQQRADRVFLDWIGPLAILNLEDLVRDEMIDYFITEQRIVDSLGGQFSVPASFKQVYPEPGQRNTTFVVYRTNESP